MKMPATRCGGYAVAREGGRISVACGVCGPAGTWSPKGARALAAALCGPLGRFETSAPRPERVRLAGLLLEAAPSASGRLPVWYVTLCKRLHLTNGGHMSQADKAGQTSRHRRNTQMQIEKGTPNGVPPAVSTPELDDTPPATLPALDKPSLPPFVTPGASPAQAIEAGWTIDGETVQRVPLELIREAPWNARKTFRKDPEFDASIASRGVLQAVKLRPISSNGAGVTFELVFGTRRFRAAKAAKQGSVPATIQTLSEAEAREENLVENLHREDVAPLEEAEALRELTQQPHSMSADEIGMKIGKSRRYVYARLQLLSLGPELRKRLAAGELPPSHAAVLARVPVQLQPEIAKAAFGYNGSVIPIRQLEDLVAQRAQRPLNGAPFALAVIYKGDDVRPNTCEDCPARLGNMPGAEKKAKVTADKCTDLICYQGKTAAAWAEAEAAAQTEGKRIVPTAQAFTFSDRPNDGFTSAEDPSSEAVVGGRVVSARKLIAEAKKKKVDLPLVVARDHAGAARELVDLSTLAKTLHPKEVQNAKDKVAAEAKRRAKDAERVDVRREARRRLYSIAGERIEKASKIDPNVLRLVLAVIVDTSYISSDQIFKRRGLEAPRSNGDYAAIKKWTQKATVPQLVGLLFELVCAGEDDGFYGPTDQAAAALFRLELRKLEKAVEADDKKAAAAPALPELPAAKAKPAKPAKKAKAKTARK